MSYDAAGIDWGNEVAAADLSTKQYFLVKQTSTGVNLCSAATDNCIGVLRRPAVAGEACSVRVHGIAEVMVGAATVAGGPLMSDANGKAVNYAAGAGNKVVGIGLKAGAADGDIIPVLLVSYDGPDA